MLFANATAERRDQAEARPWIAEGEDRVSRSRPGDEPRGHFTEPVATRELREGEQVAVLGAEAHPDRIAVHRRSPPEQKVGPDRRQIGAGMDCQPDRAVEPRVEV